uniref:Uncharacterized protein n=1 Tax=Leptospirillum sp. Group II '5-way CG' TaxID=419541 RepID=B6AQ43_9BACT|nr:MAG: Hypothetical protein CGL2_10965011 [Leptospirillum sp. Group II '5-way CG']
MYIPKSLLIVLFTVILASGVGYTYKHFRPNPSKVQTPQPAHVPSHVSPKSLEDVKTMILGTWTYTEITNPPQGVDPDLFYNLGVNKWTKIVFKAGGICTIYRALHTAENWGNGDSCQWSPITNKFVDTGERWYGVRIGVKPYTAFQIILIT